MAKKSDISFSPHKAKENILIVILSIITIFSVALTAFFVDRNLKTELVQRARTIAVLLNAIPINTLEGSMNDLDNTNYLLIKNRLADLQQVNSDTRFIYLLKETQGEIIFLVDSEPVESSEYSPPGQVYEEASFQFQDAIHFGLSGWEISHDRWGQWVTGYAPIYDAITGEYVALVGIDLDYYSNYLIPIIGYSTIPFFVFVIILITLFYTRRLQEYERQIIREKEQLMRFAHHEISTPVAETGWACENLLENDMVIQDEKTLTLARQMYISLRTLVLRTTNLLKAIELTVPKKPEFQVVDVIPLIQKALSTYKKMAEIEMKTFKIIEPFPKEALTKGDKAALTIVFTNLIAHSLYYTNEKHATKISYTETPNTHIFTTDSPGDSLKQEEVNTLFSAYYKGEPLSNHTESTGLGLYLLNKIVTIHHGTVSAEQNDVGVSIVVTLPKA